MSRKNYVDELLTRYGRTIQSPKCPYCQRGNDNEPLTDNDQDYRLTLDMRGDNPKIWSEDVLDELNSAFALINYCPICGRELK